MCRICAVRMLNMFFILCSLPEVISLLNFCMYTWIALSIFGSCVHHNRTCMPRAPAVIKLVWCHVGCMPASYHGDGGYPIRFQLRPWLFFFPWLSKVLTNEMYCYCDKICISINVECVWYSLPPQSIYLQCLIAIIRVTQSIQFVCLVCMTKKHLYWILAHYHCDGQSILSVQLHRGPVFSP